MKTTLLFALALFFTTSTFANELTYSSSADLDVGTVFHKLVDAEYAILPSRTEMRKIPNCTPNAESGEDCMREIVIESVAVVRANVSYQRSANPDSEGQEQSWLTFNFKLSDFEAGEVDMLKAHYPRYKFPFSNVFRKFAARNLELSVTTQTRMFKVLDMSQSTICRTRQDGTKVPGCKEVLVYKDAKKKVKNVTVSVK